MGAFMVVSAIAITVVLVTIVSTSVAVQPSRVTVRRLWRNRTFEPATTVMQRVARALVPSWHGASPAAQPPDRNDMEIPDLGLDY